MDQSKALVIIAGQPPVLANKLRYYAEAVFLERARIPPPDVPSIIKGATSDELADVKAENLRQRAELGAVKEQLAKITALVAYRDENVANGQPASVDMTDEEIANPETILPERLTLDHSAARSQLHALKASGQLATRDGVRDLLSSLGVKPHDTAIQDTANQRDVNV